MTGTRPLAWPDGWPRTPWGQRQKSPLRRDNDKLSVHAALTRLDLQMKRLGGRNMVVSTNLTTRDDGWPRSDQREPEDPGIAVYFSLRGRNQVLACDRWKRVADNIAAIATHIEATRKIQRYGVGSLEQAMRGYIALPAPGQQHWRAVLRLGAGPVTRDAINDQYRRRASELHPDVGGSAEAMAELNTAREAAIQEVVQ